MDNNSSSDKWTSENTIDADEEKFYRDVDKNHCNYDYIMESRVQPGKRFPAIYPGVSGARRRQDSRLGVSRVPLLEMSGAGREGFYQQRLLLSLAWWCSTPVENIAINGKEALQWTFHWTPPLPEDDGGANMEPEILKIATVPENGFSFEERCKQLEVKFGDAELGLLCACCANGASNSTCDSCRFCIGWHRCSNCPGSGFVWRAGTLHAGSLDVQRMLYNLHRRKIPTNVLEDKAAEYVSSEYLSEADKNALLAVIRAERGESGLVNDSALDGEGGPVNPGLGRRLTSEEIEAKLKKNIEMMKVGGEEGVETDQFRVFNYIVEQLEYGKKPLRLMIQASAGTGKSFLLTSVFLWALLKGVKTKACAPTGIYALLTTFPRRRKMLNVHTRTRYSFRSTRECFHGWQNPACFVPCSLVYVSLNWLVLVFCHNS